MSKQTKGYDMANFAHVTPALLATTEGVVADKKRSRYSVSAIYKAHNGVFQLREPMQTCDSCLVTRATALTKWYEWYIGQTTKQTGAPAAPVAPKADDVIVDENGKSKVIPVGAVDGAQGTTPAAATEGGTEGADGDVGGTDHHEGDGVGVDGSTEGAQGTEEGAATGNTIEGVIVPPAAAIAGTTNAAQDEGARVGGVTKVIAPQPVEVLLQKVNKDDYSKTEGDALFGLFTASADDANKGTVVNKETGKALAAGTYATEDITRVLGVQPGGKATYKPVA